MAKQLSSINDLAAVLAQIPSQGSSQSCSVFVSGCGAEMPELAPILAESLPHACVSGIFLPGINRVDYSSLTASASCETFFMTPNFKKGLAEGRVNYCPWRYRDILRRYQTSAVAVAIVMLSSPDANGQSSYGIAGDYAPIALPSAGLKIGIINRQMPAIPGVSIGLDSLDYYLEIDQPLIETQPAVVDEVSINIATRIAAYINDGAALQLGLGSIPGAVAAMITDRKHLSIHSGLIESSALDLDRAGALREQSPILGGVALGNADFYQQLQGNDRVEIQAVNITHNVPSIASQPNFVAVNGALQVDLLGQVNSCVLPNGYMSGPGGLPEFVNGALASNNGRSIIALNATAKGGSISRIVSRLEGAMPSISAVDADVVVSEFGSAELRGKSVSQRIAAMIAIADPRYQRLLLEDAKALKMA